MLVCPSSQGSAPETLSSLSGGLCRVYVCVWGGDVHCYPMLLGSEVPGGVAAAQVTQLVHGGAEPELILLFVLLLWGGERNNFYFGI